jgi:hypothetical protein
MEDKIEADLFKYKKNEKNVDDLFKQEIENYKVDND